MYLVYPYRWYSTPKKFGNYNFYRRINEIEKLEKYPTQTSGEILMTGTSRTCPHSPLIV